MVADLLYYYGKDLVKSAIQLTLWSELLKKRGVDLTGIGLMWRGPTEAMISWWFDEIKEVKWESDGPSDKFDLRDRSFHYQWV